MATETIFQATTLANFFLREGYYRHASRACQDAMAKAGDDPTLLLWKALADVQEGSTSEGIRDLESLVTHRDVQLAAIAALIYAHKRCKLVDHEAVDELSARLMIEEKSASNAACLAAAAVYLHIGDHNKAREVCNQVLESHESSNPNAQTLRGWIDLTCGRDMHISKSITYFETAIKETPQSSKRDIDALLGKARYLEMRGQFQNANDVLNQIVVVYPWFLPALTEKAKVLMKSQDWEQALETAQRVYSQDARNIDALVIMTLYILVRECRYSSAHSRLQELVQCLDVKEPKNPALYFKFAKAFSRLGSQSTQILQVTFSLVERARKFDPENSDYLTEAGYEYGMANDFSSALQAFQMASQIDDANVPALHGIIRCQLMLGQLEDAESQLEFLNEIQVSIGRSSELAFLSALMANKKKDTERCVSFLDETFELHTKALSTGKPSLDYYVQLNPYLLLEASKLYMEHCPSESLEDTDPPSPYLEKAISILEFLIKTVPGSLEGQLLYAKAKFIANDNDIAQHVIGNVLKLDPAFAHAHLLASRIFLAQENYRGAAGQLEQALSHNFEVREWPLFGLLQARVKAATNDFDAALEVLERAMSTIRAAANPRSGKAHVTVASHDKASVYLEIASVHSKMGHTFESTKAIQDAMNEFRNSSEEGRVIIANAKIALRRKDFESASTILRTVQPSSPYFLKAKVEIANIYLKYRNDRRAYTRCYEELIEGYPSAHSYLCLGEAYMQIQEPEKAIAAYESALKLKPNDTTLANKIGRALVMTHDFAKAIEYYANAVKAEPSKLSLRYDLAELYSKLQKNREAQQTIDEAIAASRGQDDVGTLTAHVKLLLLLSKIQAQNRNDEASISALNQARTVQNTILGKLRGESPEVVRAQRQVAASLCFQLGRHYDDKRDADKAQAMYAEALKQDESNIGSLLSSAKLFLKRGDADGCQQQCQALLRIDPTHEEAAIMLSDVLFRKNDVEEALSYFQKLLDKKPDHYPTLVRYVYLLRRAGKLPDAQKYFRLAEKTSGRAKFDAGLCFAKGIYHRFSNNPKEALKELNTARKDSEWGQRSLVQMIEIYCNPDGENMWSESGSSSGERAGSAGSSESHIENVRAAERLLLDLDTRCSAGISQARKIVLEAYVLLASRQKNKIEEALNKFTELCVADQDSIPGLTGMATALQMLKQTPKARNHLKRVTKMPYTEEDADDFERSYLLLADIYIQGGKYDLAQELLRRALLANKSCGRAWEFMGLIYEKEQSYQDAASCYENAWRMCNESDPGIGFKLAFNYLKAKKFVQAIDICHRVLTQFPQYPGKIRKDILDKARSALRP